MTEFEWLTVEEVAGFEKISAKQVRRRTKLGSQPALIARYEDRKAGCPVLKIDPRSMTFDAQQRYRQANLKEIGEAIRTDQESSGEARNEADAGEQAGLFALTEMDKAAEAARLELAPSQF